jgi:hypothetical protein
VLLEPTSVTVGAQGAPPPSASRASGAADPADLRYRARPDRGLGDALVVLVLLAFLLVALVTVDHALRTHAFDSPAGGGSPSAAAAP